MIHIADTSFLIAFSAIGRLDVLRRSVGDIVIPPAVFAEIVDQGVGWLAAACIQGEIAHSSWIQRIPAPNRMYLAEIQCLLGSTGEAEVVAAGLALPPSEALLLMDEKHGRNVAIARGLSVTGSLGVLGRAKRDGTIDAAGPLIRQMIEQGLYFHTDLIASFLEGLGEVWEP